MPKSALLRRLETIRNKPKANKYRPAFPDLKVEGSRLSNNLKVKGAFKQDKLRDHLWRKGHEEKPATVEEMEKKSKRVRMHHSKGNYMYATDGDNSGPLTIHRK